MLNKSNRLLLVDLDGTLLQGNSLPYFLLLAVGWWKLLLGLPMLLLRWAGLLIQGNFGSGKLKETLFFNYLRGHHREALEQWGAQCVKQKLLSRLNFGVKMPLDEALTLGDTVVLVTASLDIWVTPLAHQLGYQSICTQVEYDAEGVFSGRFATPNCKYGEKRRRILEKFDLNGYSRVVAYGNSDGDAAMFELADEIWWVKRDGRVVCRKKAE